MAIAIVLLTVVSAVLAAPQFPAGVPELPGGFSGMIPPIPGASNNTEAGGEEGAARVVSMPTMEGNFSGSFPMPGGAGNKTEPAPTGESESRIGKPPTNVPQMPSGMGN